MLKTPSTSRLRLSRETLRHLEAEQMRRAAGGGATNTCYSCYEYVSCNALQCAVNKVSAAFADGCGPA